MTINYQLKAKDWTLGQEESKRPRRRSLKRTIKAAGRSGKSVIAITTNGVTLHFGPDGNAVGNEWNEVCRVKN